MKGLEVLVVILIEMADDAALFESRIEQELSEDAEDAETVSDNIWRLSYYPSNQQEQYIVNAVSGTPYPFRVGSNESLQLFHVTDATGTCDSRGYRGAVNREPNHLYYSDPQEYMRHRGGQHTLDKSFVEAWRSKVNWLFPSSGDSKPDPQALDAIRVEYSAKIARQHEEARARDEAVRAAALAAEERKAMRKVYEEELAEAMAINKVRAKAARKEEAAAAKKEHNKRKRILRRERKRQAAQAAVAKAAHAARKSERRRRDYARMHSRKDSTLSLQRTYSVVESH